LFNIIINVALAFVLFWSLQAVWSGLKKDSQDSEIFEMDGGEIEAEKSTVLQIWFDVRVDFDDGLLFQRAEVLS